MAVFWIQHYNTVFIIPHHIVMADEPSPVRVGSSGDIGQASQGQFLKRLHLLQ